MESRTKPHAGSRRTEASHEPGTVRIGEPASKPMPGPADLEAIRPGTATSRANAMQRTFSSATTMSPAGHAFAVTVTCSARSTACLLLRSFNLPRSCSPSVLPPLLRSLCSAPLLCSFCSAPFAPLLRSFAPLLCSSCPAPLLRSVRPVPLCASTSCPLLCCFRPARSCSSSGLSRCCSQDLPRSCSPHDWARSLLSPAPSPGAPRLWSALSRPASRSAARSWPGPRGGRTASALGSVRTRSGASGTQADPSGPERGEWGRGRERG